MEEAKAKVKVTLEIEGRETQILEGHEVIVAVANHDNEEIKQIHYCSRLLAANLALRLANQL